MHSTDHQAEAEGIALSRQFSMPRPRDGQTKVHKVDTGGRERARRRREDLKRAFEIKPRSLNDDLSTGLWMYLHGTK